MMPRQKQTTANVVAAEVRAVLGLDKVLSNHELLRSALLMNVGDLRHSNLRISGDAAKELAYVQASVYAALMLNDEALLQKLTGEIHDIGVGQRLPFKARTAEMVNAAISLQSMWRKRRRVNMLRNVLRSVPNMSAELRAKIAIARPQMACLVFGALNMDLKATVELADGDEHAAAARTSQGRFSSLPGGKAGNEAVAISKLSIDTVLVGRIGDDDLGAAVLASLQRESTRSGGHLALEICRDQREPTGVAVQIVQGHRTQAVVCGGANWKADDEATTIAAKRRLTAIDAPEVLLMQLEVQPLEVLVELARVAHTRGRIVVLKTSPLNQEVCRTLLPALLSLCDVLFLNEEEAATLVKFTPALARQEPPVLPRGARTVALAADAERAAGAIMSQWPNLQTVIITASTGTAASGSSSPGRCYALNVPRSRPACGSTRAAPPPHVRTTLGRRRHAGAL